MRIAAFDDDRIGVVARDDTVVDVTDLLHAVRSAGTRGSVAGADYAFRSAPAGTGAQDDDRLDLLGSELRRA